MKRQILTALCAAMALFAGAQSAVWQTAGNSGQNATTDFLGNTDPVPMNIRTQDIRRFRLNFDETYTIGAFNTQAKDGGLLLGADVDGFYTAGGPGPFSALHLIEPNSINTQALGYRPWMRNGVTFTGNSDLGYIGHKYAVDGNGNLLNDQTDMVVHWSNDGNSQFGPDRLSFRFTSTSNSAVATGSPSWEGLEGMRLLPVDANNINVGVGDFVAGADDPTERLDVRTGRLRIRELPDDPEMEDAYRVMVVDDTADPLERGVVKWVDPAVLVPTDCEWSMNTASPNHVYTAVGATDPDCPDDAEAVGIGYDLSSVTPPAKLSVYTESYNIGTDVTVNVAAPETRGVNVLATGATDYEYGVFSEVHSSAKRTRGVYGVSGGATYYGIGGLFVSNDEATYTTGAQGHVKAGEDSGFGVLGTCISNAKLNVGVRGHVYSTNDDASRVYYGVQGLSAVTPHGLQLACGVRGEAVTGAGLNSWAVYSLGNQFSSTGTAWTFSDPTLKTDIEPLQNALAQVMQLRPSSYRFRNEEFPHLNLATESQYGFLAPELEEVQPQMVRDVHIPAETDSTGAELQAAMDLKAVKLDGMVPLVVAAMQEQQLLIAAQEEALDELRDQMNEMQQALAACCANRDAGTLQDGANGISTLATDADAERKLRIQPNPFSEPPTVFYILDRSGRMQLIANSADGKELSVLQEATLQAGSYQYQWDTTDLAPGMYYVTLLMDGQPLVKKAVKVTR